MEQKLEKIKSKFNSLWEEVVILRQHHILFLQMEDIIQANEEFEKHLAFVLSWFRSACLNDLIIRTYKILDKEKRTDSLINFLNQITNDPIAENFDNLSSEIDKDIKYTTESADYNQIVKTRHNYVAHLATKRNKVTLMEFKELDNLITQIAQAIKKYSVILFDTEYSATPIFFNI